MAISFRDTGHGIPSENLKTIFNPFFTTKDTGTGLGLAITHKVISEHGGYIDVKSRVGEGSCLTVYIPASAE
jgi:two-component system sensor histidine kinase AtoS